MGVEQIDASLTLLDLNRTSIDDPVANDLAQILWFVLLFFISLGFAYCVDSFVSFFVFLLHQQ